MSRALKPAFITAAAVPPPQPGANPWGLTPGQARVMSAICTHGCQKLAARALGISVPTVEAHVTQAGRRMAPRTRLGKYLAWDRWMRTTANSEATS